MRSEYGQSDSTLEDLGSEDQGKLP
jgi:hypothetical protein